jgi:hypothetical protein
MSDAEASIDEVRAAAACAGLSLTDAEIEKLQHSAGRIKAWGERIRASISLSDEPAVTFAPRRWQP